MSNIRKSKRATLTRSEVKKQTKVITRYNNQLNLYKEMTLDELKEIASQKRSKTDHFAFLAAIDGKKQPTADLSPVPSP
jgi:hypothetical protein